ncbi:MAG: anti-sigma factor [Thermoleophilia bacterium]
MTCQEMVELVTGYLEGRLTAADHDRFEAHLALCDGCRAYLDQIRATVDAMGRLPAVELTPEMRDVLLDAFRDWRGDRA